MDLGKYAKRVSGKKRGEVLLFALSTCGWCKKTKGLLNELGVEYSYIDVDLLDKAANEYVVKELSKWNDRCSFPTLVVNNGVCIIGFQEEKIREVIGVG